MTGASRGLPLEHVLARREWLPPVTRSLTVRFTPAEAMATKWFDRVHLSPDYQIASWGDLSIAERDEIRRSHERSPWIATGLEPWRHESGFDPISSLGLRYQGTIVGWVINHRLAAGMVRFTCSFMRADLGRRGRTLALYTESIRRLALTGCRSCSLVTPLEYTDMVHFLKRRCARAVHFFGETRGSSKTLRA